jgi:hypothetical protein
MISTGREWPHRVVKRPSPERRQRRERAGSGNSNLRPARVGVLDIRPAHYIKGMNVELDDDQAAALIKELAEIVEGDPYPFSPRISTLRAILEKLAPQPVREPLPPPKHYLPPRATLAKWRRG